VREADPPLIGRHPVLELLRADSRRVEEIAIIAEGRGPALQELLTLAKSRGVKISFRTREQLTSMAGTPHHQGVVARAAGLPVAFSTLPIRSRTASLPWMLGLSSLTRSSGDIFSRAPIA